MLRAHELIKQRLCWHMHTHRNSSQPLAMQRLIEFPVFCHFLVKVTVHSAKEMGSNGLGWVRLELPAFTYQTPVGRPTPHNTIKTMRRAHQDSKEKQIWEWSARNMAVWVMPGVINNLTVIGALQKAVSLLYPLYPLAQREDLLLFGSCWTKDCVRCSVFMSVSHCQEVSIGKHALLNIIRLETISL